MLNHFPGAKEKFRGTGGHNRDRILARKIPRPAVISDWHYTLHWIPRELAELRISIVSEIPLYQTGITLTFNSSSLWFRLCFSFWITSSFSCKLASFVSRSPCYERKKHVRLKKEAISENILESLRPALGTIVRHLIQISATLFALFPSFANFRLSILWLSISLNKDLGICKQIV